MLLCEAVTIEDLVALKAGDVLEGIETRNNTTGPWEVSRSIARSMWPQDPANPSIFLPIEEHEKGKTQEVDLHTQNKWVSIGIRSKADGKGDQFDTGYWFNDDGTPKPDLATIIDGITITPAGTWSQDREAEGKTGEKEETWFSKVAQWAVSAPFKQMAQGDIGSQDMITRTGLDWAGRATQATAKWALGKKTTGGSGAEGL